MNRSEDMLKSSNVPWLQDDVANEELKEYAFAQLKGNPLTRAYALPFHFYTLDRRQLFTLKF